MGILPSTTTPAGLVLLSLAGLLVGVWLASYRSIRTHLLITRVKPGDGITYPRIGDTLTMHYTGSFVNGTKFDSSYARGEPFSFVVGRNQVIRGWDKGLMQLSLGERAVLHVPSEQGYGERGVGNVIPPDTDLDFDVELLRIRRESIA